MKNHHPYGAKTTGLPSAAPAARRTTVVRTGHPVLDLALAAERSAPPSLRQLRDACRATAAADLAHVESPAPLTGRPADALALTLDRGGRGPTLHVATTHRIVDVRRRARTITVWHELATFDGN